MSTANKIAIKTYPQLGESHFRDHFLPHRSPHHLPASHTLNTEQLWLPQWVQIKSWPWLARKRRFRLVTGIRAELTCDWQRKVEICKINWCVCVCVCLKQGEKFSQQVLSANLCSIEGGGSGGVNSYNSGSEDTGPYRCDIPTKMGLRARRSRWCGKADLRRGRLETRKVRVNE